MVALRSLYGGQTSKSLSQERPAEEMFEVSLPFREPLTSHLGILLPRQVWAGKWVALMLIRGRSVTLTWPLGWRLRPDGRVLVGGQSADRTPDALALPPLCLLLLMTAPCS